MSSVYGLTVEKTARIGHDTAKPQPSWPCRRRRASQRTCGRHIDNAFGCQGLSSTEATKGDKNHLCGREYQDPSSISLAIRVTACYMQSDHVLWARDSRWHCKSRRIRFGKQLRRHTANHGLECFVGDIPAVSILHCLCVVTPHTPDPGAWTAELRSCKLSICCNPSARLSDSKSFALQRIKRGRPTWLRQMQLLAHTADDQPIRHKRS
ncbi:hypothetical protein GY45DRAFT_1325075 [Cubamyces sp. BRFM 1775]|nr:hypothetical protein GY45DRAFT_1325075 [Cubamyces sp. BRFM 1775]